LAIIATWYMILLGAYLLVPALKDAILARALDTLRGVFAGDVQVQSFDVSLWPRVQMSARGMTIGDNPAHPLIRAEIADAQCGLLPWHVRRLALRGLSLHLPAVRVAGAKKPAYVWNVSIDEIVSEGVYLEILPSGGKQTPLHFELARLRLNNFNPAGVADFSADLAIGELGALIQTSGRLGPWNALDPSATPLQGVYAMPRCDLAALPELRGAVSSNGRFRGILQRIEISGAASASEFSLSPEERPQPLRATFQAAVDAWDGSASIEQVQGLLHTGEFVASGFVRNVQDDRRRDIAVRLSVIRGRLHDVVPLAARSGRGFYPQFAVDVGGETAHAGSRASRVVFSH
jgi:hypothetical protein